jgi:hypothetical protein
MNWINVNEILPHDQEDYHAYKESIRVLATDGDRHRVAYCQKWPDGKVRWIEVGPDGYDLPNVTHWMHLPALPKVFADFA